MAVSYAITVAVRGRTVNQVLFIQDDLLDSHLDSVREALLDQNVDTGPGEYLFLTTKGDVISMAQENFLTLRQITSELSADKTSTEPFVKIELNGKTATTLNPESSEKSKLDYRLHIRIIPANDKTIAGGSESKTKNDGTSKAKACEFKCPFQGLKDIVNIHDHMTLKTLLKALLASIFALTCLIIIATCSLQMLSSMFMDMGHLTGRPGSGSESDLQFQKVEMLMTYKMAEMDRLLVELGNGLQTQMNKLTQEMADLKAGLTKKFHSDYSGKEKKKEKYRAVEDL